MIVIKGKAKWAKVFEPDTRFVDDGEYSTQVIMSEAEAAEVCEQLESLVDEAYNKAVKEKPALKASLSKRPVTEPEVDQDGNETGNVVFKTKLKALIRAKNGSTYKQKVQVVDSKRKPMNADQAVGNGSVIKVAVEPVTYVMASTKQVGVSLRLKAVQVIDLVESGASAESIFDEEDGFVASAVEKDDTGDVFNENDTSSVDEKNEGDF